MASPLLRRAALCARVARAEILIGVAGPMTGANAWFGEQYQRDTGLAVADLNARGGVLGQSVELIVGADACDPDQAVALARKLASDGVVVVAGHFCSHASIPASKIYEEAGILMVAPMHSRQFDTVLGRIAFDQKGDVTGFDPSQWYVWQGGDYEPAPNLGD